MSKFFYPKLAVENIRKNKKTYLPYLLTCIFTSAMCYIIRSLSLNEGIGKMIGADTVTQIMAFGSFVVAIFAVIFLFYTNSFLIRRRKKEFGLFNILGMEKRHLIKVIAFETLYVAVISMIFGLGLGIALDKVMYLLILNMLGTVIPLGFYVSIEAIIFTLILFGIIFVLIFFNSLFQIHLSKPIELLYGNRLGEKEPKTKKVMTVLGVACLGTGYYIALTTQNPLSALSHFFVAVLLVIAGTYFLFTAGSISLLKILRKNKKYYYKTKHFVSVSGMIYRMKQNAVGLANICVLSTAVLVMISTTSSTMIGMEDIIKNRYPYDITLYSGEAAGERQEEMVATARKTAEKHQAEMSGEISYTYLTFAGMRQENRFITDQSSNVIVMNDIYHLFFVPLSDYNRVTGESETLQEGQIMLYANRAAFDDDTLCVFDREYQIIKRLDHFLGNGIMASNIISSYFIVVKDMGELQYLYEAQKQAYEEMASEIKNCFSFNISGDHDTKIAVYKELQESLHEKEYQGTIESREDSKNSFLGLYGGLFFLGILLGSLFLMATALIIYYKQISEGYDDKERFEIMQKVGMNHTEVKKSIHSQILTVFFLPLVTAGIHVVFAFPLISKLLALLNLTNTGLYILCTIGCFCIFSVLYGIIYGMTAKTYYRIVSR